MKTGLLFRGIFVRPRVLARLRRHYRIESVRRESPMVSTLVLAPRHVWQGGMRFAAGQFAWIRMRRADGAEVSRSFTTAVPGRRSRRLEFTVRHTGDVAAVLAGLRVGCSVEVDGPHGPAAVDHRGRRGLLLIAGGVGVTPMMSILRTLDHRGDRRPIGLLALARHPDDLLFQAELQALSRRMPLRVIELLSDPPPGWGGPCGQVDAGILATALPAGRGSSEVDVYLCGSPPMVEAALAGLAELGVPPDRIRTEHLALTRAEDRV